MEQRSLYVSSYSEASKNAVEAMQQLHLENNISVVGIDNPDTRELIKHGKKFTITVVPTLVVESEGGNIKVYQGPKTIQYMQAIAAEMVAPPPFQQIQSRRRKRPKSKMLQHLKKKPQPPPPDESDDESDDKSDDESEDDEYEEDYEVLEEDGGDDEETEYVSTIPGGGGQDGIVQKGKIQNIGAIMSQMEAQFKQSLGYSRKNLPSF